MTDSQSYQSHRFRIFVDVAKNGQYGARAKLKHITACCSRIPSVISPALNRWLPQSFVNNSIRHHYYQAGEI
jgi:hypothetical protein